MQPAIVTENLSKQYHLGSGLNGGYQTLRESLARAALQPWKRLRRGLSGFSGNGQGSEEAAVPSGTFWALKDVCFEVKPGEVVGIIGRNGAGKSTLLKIVSRITEPTAGRVRLHGRVGSLLEVGTGFHQELTGRENIYLNGAILGMSHAEITRKFDAIVDFAEIELFLDTPVKRYSSGMYVRLAFAVASHLEPEILIVDEVLAVGDMAFQKKCLGKMGEASRSGRTILFVSHNMAAILNLCETVAVLQKGILTYVGPAPKGVEHYMSSTVGAGASDVNLAEHPNRTASLQPVLRRLRLLNDQGIATDQFLAGEGLQFELTVQSGNLSRQLNFRIAVEDAHGCRLFTMGTHLASGPLSMQPVTRVVCRLAELPLPPGRYCLCLSAGIPPTGMIDQIDQAAWFDVLAGDFYGNGQTPHSFLGSFLVRSQWQAEPAP
jgi:lipopolysaccharide transport system ATP-binding protein